MQSQADLAGRPNHPRRPQRGLVANGLHAAESLRQSASRDFPRIRTYATAAGRHTLHGRNPAARALASSCSHTMFFSNACRPV
jgi:hypothetical protein